MKVMMRSIHNSKKKKNHNFGRVVLELDMEYADLDTFKDMVKECNIHLERLVLFPKKKKMTR